jgi:hypothetical protein
MKSNIYNDETVHFAMLPVQENPPSGQIKGKYMLCMQAEDEKEPEVNS